MDSQAPREGTTGLLPSAKTVALTGAVVLVASLFNRPKTGAEFWRQIVLVCVAVLARIWVQTASHYVPEPYLDEVFHVPQAQKYCEGKFSEWDDKLTTPPGLYLLSLVIPKNSLGLDVTKVFACDTERLRGVNALALTVVAWLALLSRQEIESRLHEAHAPTKIRAPSQYALHTAFNIALCPIIFFFSGLYYTDVASTAVVLAAFLNSLKRVGRDESSIWSDLLTVLLGILALLMRQTNVFWVVVFLGGLEAIHAVKTLRPQRVAEPAVKTMAEKLGFFAWRYSVGDVHDPPLHMAWEDDMFFTAISLVVAALCNPLRVFRQIWPHITVLVSFVAFIAWNGGVVLGDKSNHVATIHLAQMLYIWPLFAFFSVPLLLPYALGLINRLYILVKPRGGRPAEPLESSTASAPGNGSRRGGLSKGSSRGTTAGVTTASTTQEQTPQAQRQTDQKDWWTTTVFNSKLYWPIYLMATIVLSFVIVKYNTIIHPFTLADNRHYMFYIFRYTIRRSTWVRYSLVLPYTISRWMTWGTLAGCYRWFMEGKGENCSMYYGWEDKTPFRNHPFTRDVGRLQSDATFPGAFPVESEEARAEKQTLADQALGQDPLVYSTEPISTSTALVFLLATTLSLITAPLVEPRYFIIPWVVWRLLVPAWRLHDHHPAATNLVEDVRRGYPTPGKVVDFFRRHDLRLWLETLWFLVINLVTIYIFLFKPFQWRAEDGTLLDEGRWQRFMW